MSVRYQVLQRPLYSLLFRARFCLAILSNASTAMTLPPLPILRKRGPTPIVLAWPGDLNRRICRSRARPEDPRHRES